ncbi:hypothetical protein BJX62DRAFT_245228 [Aspergillus germanicus]
MDTAKAAAESRTTPNRSIPYRARMLDDSWIGESILNSTYPGSGISSDPFIVGWTSIASRINGWTSNASRDPMQFTRAVRWAWTGLVSIATFVVALATSAYSAPSAQVIEEFGISELVFQVGLAAFILDAYSKTNKKWAKQKN